MNVYQELPMIDIMKYTESMPILSHDLEFNCTKCNEANTYNLRGMQDFF